jgi:hypothetical protein
MSTVEDELCRNTYIKAEGLLIQETRSRVASTILLFVWGISRKDWTLTSRSPMYSVRNIDIASVLPIR